MGEMLPVAAEAGGWLTVSSVVGLVVGAAVLGAGLWLVRARGTDRGTPTRLTVGLAGMIGGYHLVAWSLPAGWLALRVPAERWWVVAGGAALAIIASLIVDAYERRLMA